MKLRPTIFLSGVSSEFASFRDAVEIEVQKKGCFPINQPSFSVDYREIENILRRSIGEADAVIHIVGFRFGFEPRERAASKLRRSYTQVEYDIARELQKPVYVFLSSEVNVRDPASFDEHPEDAEAIALQLEHRQAIQSSNNLYYFFKNKYELSKLVGEIPQVVTFDFRADISRIVQYAPAGLIGREDELDLLNAAWLKVRRGESPRPHILTLVALGGEGKTSLVAKWAAELALHNWPGCDAAFAWSFYSQGAHEQSAASSDHFLKEAITFFGNEADEEFASSNAGAYEKGQRLARIVTQRRSLLILDGLEPLQYSPASPMPGELKDSGLAALLKNLAADSEGLCVITTRYSLSDLKGFWRTSAVEVNLSRLSCDAGVHLLKSLGVRGMDEEFESVVEDVKGHALTLTLLGGFLRRAFQGDIRQRDRVGLVKADAAVGGHAFRLLAAYERHLSEQFAKGVRENIKSKRPSVFLSHASEDKTTFARPLANALKQRGLDVWFDEFELKLGDSIRGEIDRAVAECDFAVALLSEHFFQKPWPQQEVSGLTAREISEKRKIILPIWHGVDLERVTRYSPLLADRLAVSSSKGAEVIAEDILQAISPQFYSVARVQRSPELMLLRLFGLFEGPISFELLRVLLEPPEIPELTDGLVGLPTERLNQVLYELAECNLINFVSNHQNDNDVVDLHPLVREFFSLRLKEECLSSFEQAHSRLFEHFRGKSQYRPTQFEEFTQLYRAIIHGCLARRHQESKSVYINQILRGSENYSTRVLGAVGANLRAVSCFFEAPWSEPVKSLSKEDQGWLLNEAAWLLQALGRLIEALEPMRSAMEIRRTQGDFVGSTITASNLSELELTLGNVVGAVAAAEQAVMYADRSGNTFQQMIMRTTHADVLHQAGCRTESEMLFRDAEQMQQEIQAEYPLLYSLQGFQYCDLLLAEMECATWRRTLETGKLSKLTLDARFPGSQERSKSDKVLHDELLCNISIRATQTLGWAKAFAGASILAHALDHLTLSRVALYSAVLLESRLTNVENLNFKTMIENSMTGLRHSGQQQHLPAGLLTRAWWRFLIGSTGGPGRTTEDLDEAWEIAERGPMRLHMADIHLYRARLFFREKEYPWESPEADLAAARKLIEQCGYWRRKEELEDAERVILKKSV